MAGGKKSFMYKTRKCKYSFRYVLMLAALLADGERTAGELGIVSPCIVLAAIDLAWLGIIKREKQRCPWGPCSHKVVYRLP